MGKNWNLKGCFIPVITPFKDDFSVDVPGLRTLVDYCIEDQKADAIVPVGTTGESPTLSHEEHIEVIRVVFEQTRGRVPVIAGTGSNSTKEAIELTRAAAEVGVDGSLQVSPYYNRPSQAGIIQHFQAVAASTALPLILYNIPGRTGRNIDPPTIVQLAQVDNIVGLKDAAGDLIQTMAIIKDRPGGFAVYSGEDALTFPMLALGGEGVIAASAHVVGLDMGEMCRLAFERKFEEARAIHFRVLEIINALFCEPNPVPVKQALTWMGLPAGPVRLPLVGMSEAGRKTLRAALDHLGKI